MRATAREFLRRDKTEHARPVRRGVVSMSVHLDLATVDLVQETLHLARNPRDLLASETHLHDAVLDPHAAVGSHVRGRLHRNVMTIAQLPLAEHAQLRCELILGPAVARARSCPSAAGRHAGSASPCHGRCRAMRRRRRDRSRRHAVPARPSEMRKLPWLESRCSIRKVKTLSWPMCRAYTASVSNLFMSRMSGGFVTFCSQYCTTQSTSSAPLKVGFTAAGSW